MTDMMHLIPGNLGFQEHEEYMGIISTYLKQDKSRDPKTVMEEAKNKYEHDGGMQAVRKMIETTSKKSTYTKQKEEIILRYSLKYPLLGVDTLSERIKAEENSDPNISPGNIKRAFRENDLDKANARIARLKEEFKGREPDMSAIQRKALYRKTTLLDETGVITRPVTTFVGELCTQDTFMTGRWERLGRDIKGNPHRLYQQTFLDLNSMYLFAQLSFKRKAIHATTFLTQRVMPQFQESNHSIKAILTDHGTEFKSEDQSHIYEMVFAASDIKHKLTEKQTGEREADKNIYTQVIHNYMREHFYKKIRADKEIKTIEEIQAELDKWLEDFNSKPSPFIENEEIVPVKAFKPTESS